MKKAEKTSLLIIALAAVCGILPLLLNGSDQEQRDDREYMEIGYSDLISFVVQGYKCHWEGMNPEDMELSPVYSYESESMGFAKKDLDGDGTEELLFGDDFGPGNYALYDIFTYDSRTGNVVHLLSGGERDTFIVTGDGIIIETGSSSSSDSFEQYYTVEEDSVKDTECPEDGKPAVLQFEKFVRFAAPGEYVALKDGKVLGQLIRIREDSYLVEVQDSVSVPKDGVDIEYWSAADGKGVVFLKDFGKQPVYELPDSTSRVIGKAVYDEGYCPDTYRCLGYKPGWLRVKLDGNRTGYISENVTDWDYEDRF